MKFNEFPYGSNNQIANPECGKKKASEVHFYINVMKYPVKNDQTETDQTETDQTETDQTETDQTENDQTDNDQNENDETNSIDLVSIKLGDKFKLVLGMKHVKIYKVESENEENLFFKVSALIFSDLLLVGT
jgi:sRNA-binding protein